jgi:hypothetical protein
VQVWLSAFFAECRLRSFERIALEESAFSEWIAGAHKKMSYLVVVVDLRVCFLRMLFFQ